MFSQWMGQFFVFQKVAISTTLIVLLAACSPKATDLADGGLLTTDDLGESSTGILGGEAVVAGDAVAHATVGILNKRFGQVVCTATLVSRNLVLTAGHCTVEDPSDLAIVFTIDLPQTREHASQIVVRQVVAGQTHPQWPQNNFMNEKNWGDIALLRFDGDLPTGYTPIRLLSKTALLVAGGEATLAGFGWTDGRRRTEATGMNKVVVKIENPAFSDMELLFNQQEGKGACHGDSGGPAFIDVQGHLVLVGVTSRGHDDPADTCQRFSIYSSVATQIDWLKATAVELQKTESVGKKMPQPF